MNIKTISAVGNSCSFCTRKNAEVLEVTGVTFIKVRICHKCKDQLVGQPEVSKIEKGIVMTDSKKTQPSVFSNRSQLRHISDILDMSKQNQQCIAENVKAAHAALDKIIGQNENDDVWLGAVQDCLNQIECANGQRAE